ELARLVRRIHGGRAGRPRVAVMKACNAFGIHSGAPGRARMTGPSIRTLGEVLMKKIAFALVAVAAAAGVVARIGPAYGQTNGQAAPVFVNKIPPGYRDWRLLSVAHEEGNLNSFAAVLGNDVAIKAYREGTLPFPDGTIIAALHYSHIPSEEN